MVIHRKEKMQMKNHLHPLKINNLIKKIKKLIQLLKYFLGIKNELPYVSEINWQFYIGSTSVTTTTLLYIFSPCNKLMWLRITFL